MNYYQNPSNGPFPHLSKFKFALIIIQDSPCFVYALVFTPEDAVITLFDLAEIIRFTSDR